MENFMKGALHEAELAMKEGEVPVGAVVVLEGKIIGRGHNRIEGLKDPTAHAEIIAITSACNFISKWRLVGATIYVTLEPCPMCAGAIMLSRISRCVFGTTDPIMGAFGSVYDIKSPKLEVLGGVLNRECLSLIQDFFKTRREE